jgi:spore coat protein A
MRHGSTRRCAPGRPTRRANPQPEVIHCRSPPPQEETGLKDTVKTNPGQVTVVRARFTPPATAFAGGQLTTQKYVHHCHIVEHEDNDMMERVIVSA